MYSSLSYPLKGAGLKFIHLQKLQKRPPITLESRRGATLLLFMSDCGKAHKSTGLLSGRKICTPRLFLLSRLNPYIFPFLRYLISIPIRNLIYGSSANTIDYSYKPPTVRTEYNPTVFFMSISNWLLIPRLFINFLFYLKFPFCEALIIHHRATSKNLHYFLSFSSVPAIFPLPLMS